MFLPHRGPGQSRQSVGREEGITVDSRRKHIGRQSALQIAVAGGILARGLGGAPVAMVDSALAWGDNVYGQLGNRSSTNSNVPVAVTGLSSGVTAVAAGDHHSLAIQNGNVYAWGWDSLGQLGNGGDWHKGRAGAGAGSVHGRGRCRGLVRFQLRALRRRRPVGVGINHVGQLGLGDVRNRTSPTQLKAPAGYRFTGLDAGIFHAVATVAAVPEPGSLVLSALGCCVVVGRVDWLARRAPRSRSA